MHAIYKSIGIICLALLSCSLHADTDAPAPIITKNWKSIPFVDTNDPTVISITNFAVQQVNFGSLYKLIYAQQQAMTEGSVYIVTVELVDAYAKHHVYQIQVYVPADSTDWQVIYSSSVNR